MSLWSYLSVNCILSSITIGPTSDSQGSQIGGEKSQRKIFCLFVWEERYLSHFVCVCACVRTHMSVSVSVLSRRSGDYGRGRDPGDEWTDGTCWRSHHRQNFRERIEVDVSQGEPMRETYVSQESTAFPRKSSDFFSSQFYNSKKHLGINLTKEMGVSPVSALPASVLSWIQPPLVYEYLVQSLEKGHYPQLPNVSRLPWLESQSASWDFC